MVKIGIIGTGNIGKRHIQSIAELENVELVCHDAFEESLNSVNNFVKDNSLYFLSIDLEKTLDNFLSKIDSETIIIISTTANGRAELIKKVVSHNPKALIVEKPVCQNREDYENLIDICNNIPVYVNFPRHMYPFYQEIKEKIKGLDVTIDINLDNVGLGCNGTHFIDVACWLTGSKNYLIVDSKIREVYESKRKGFSDFSGEIKLKLDDKHIVNIVDLKTENSEEGNSVSINLSKEVITIFEERDRKTIKNSKGITAEKIDLPYQSELSSIFISEILEKGEITSLPSLEEGFMAHNILFEIMKKHDLEDLNIT